MAAAAAAAACAKEEEEEDQQYEACHPEMYAQELEYVQQHAVKADAATVAYEHLALGRRGCNGCYYAVLEPPTVLLLQNQAAPSLCAHCHQRHGKLIVQRITVRHMRQGHGTQVMRALLEALPLNVGLYLQSTITPASRALARRLGMTPQPHTFDEDQWDWCRNH